MTEQNRTERRLLESIRKAKTGAVRDTGSQADAVVQPSTQAGPPGAQGGAPRAAPRRSPRGAETPRRIGRYQSPGRVWPD
jgi:hypothetical protein